MLPYPSVVKSKLPAVGTTIFTTMSQLANEYDAINLSQGFPDFPSDAKLTDLVHSYMTKGYNQYAPMAGILPLREAIAQKATDMYNISYDPDKEITITAGGTQAIYTAITALIEEEDEVIIFEPAYDCYAPAIQLNKGIPVFIELVAPDYKIDWEHVKKRINHRTKMIIINTPHNPTGSVWGEEDMQLLEKITRGTDIIILSDEVYEHIIFDGQHQSILRFPELARRSLVIFSFGKTFHNTGWKIGYCMAPANLMQEFRKVHQFMVFSVNTPIQYALADFLKDKENYLHLHELYIEKRDYFLSLIKGSKFRYSPAKGTYFQLLSYKDISEEKDTDFAIRLTKEYGVASVPVSVFYHEHTDNKMLRFCFAKSNETLEKAAERLCRI